MENRQKILSDKHILGKLNEHSLTNTVMEAMTDYAQEQANKNFVQPYVSKSLAPYRCPICGGNGLVSGSFYTSLLGCGGTSTNITEKCRSCDGNGLLWG